MLGVQIMQKILPSSAYTSFSTRCKHNWHNFRWVSVLIWRRQQSFESRGIFKTNQGYFWVHTFICMHTASDTLKRVCIWIYLKKCASTQKLAYLKATGLKLYSSDMASLSCLEKAGGEKRMSYFGARANVPEFHAIILAVLKTDNLNFMVQFCMKLHGHCSVWEVVLLNAAHVVVAFLQKS